MSEVSIVEGWTGDIEFQLKDDGTAADLGSDTITAEARNKKRESVTLTGDLTIVTATDGKVRMNPDTGDFVSPQSPYELRFKRATGTGVVYYPSDDAVRLNVRPWNT